MKETYTRRGQTQKAVQNKISHSVLDTESSTQAVVGQALPDNALKGHPVKNKTSLSRLFTSPLAGCSPHGQGRADSSLQFAGLFAREPDCRFLHPSREKVGGARMRGYLLGFTLIELLVAIMIIGILAAVAVPQYQKAVMKSRFAAMMPIAKTLANANEVYYAEHDEYSTDPAKLNVTPQAGTPDGTAINMYSNPEEVSFVRVENPGVPNARYVVYQKLSENFPETTWCEAGDTRTEELCVALGGTLPEGLTGNSSGDNTNYKAYLLTGQARSGDKFAEPVCLGAVCDGNGNITECNSGETLNNGECVTCDIPNATECSTTAYAATACGTGYTLNNGSCEDCATAFPNATACSATSYAPTACSEGYILNGNACEVDPTYAQLRAQANSLCPDNQTRYVCTITKNGTVSKCDTNHGTINEQGECVSNGKTGNEYETVYNPDGTVKQMHQCYVASNPSGQCSEDWFYDYTAGTLKVRHCANNSAITKDLTCTNGYSASSSRDDTVNSHGHPVDSNTCSVVNEQGVCTAYQTMYHTDYTYNGNSVAGRVTSQCVSVSEKTCVGNNYKNIEAFKGSNMVRCVVPSNPGISAPILVDGTCSSGMQIMQKYVLNGKTTYKTCSSYNSINWQEATCS